MGIVHVKLSGLFNEKPQSCRLFSTWPHLRCDVDLDSGGMGILKKTVTMLQYCVLL